MSNERFKTTSFLQESRYFEDARMSLLLQGTDKDELASSVRRPIDPSSDLGKLDVCFGGFTPMALSDGLASAEQVEAAQRRAQERRQAAERVAAIEAARASEARTWLDADGSIWHYVVLDDSEVRVERCECASSVLVIPSTIEGKPVVSLAAEACAEAMLAESLDMPDTVISVGLGAFRGCDNLRRIRFSNTLDRFDAGWLRGCRKLEELRLPGQLEKITSAVFDVPALKHLSIGAAACEVAPGAFAKSQLDAVHVAPENGYMATDGCALYSKDGSIMVALAVPLTAYEVAAGCRAIAKKGFSNFECLQQVGLPDSLESIGDYAFSRTGIASFCAPKGLRAIGERAFFACASLAHVVLDADIEVIGAHAFSDTAIDKLRLPATVVELGHPIAAGTTLTYSGEDATFTIGAEEATSTGASQQLLLDEQGALYRRVEDGLHLVRMLEPAARTYEAHPDTVAIDEGAFAKHPSLTAISLPEGLMRIGKGAFKDCHTLTEIRLPETLAEIEEEAFLGTNIEALVLPTSLTRIGAIALITEGAHHGTMEPALRYIEVAPDNQRYRMDQGLLIERLGNGRDRIILCTGEEPDVVVPESVTAVAQYAFNGVRRLRTLSISDRLQAIDVRGMALDCLLENLHVDVREPIDGRKSFDFRFPSTSRAAQQMRLAFGSCNAIEVASIFDHYDNAIVTRSGFDAENEDQLSAYEQGSRIVERLLDPICMTPNNQALMEASLRNHLIAVCIDAARHDDRTIFEGLLDLGFISEDNMSDIIEAVSGVQDASVTNYLLEQKQRRFGAAAIDFEL